MASQRIAGTCYLTIGAIQYSIRGSFTWMGSQTKREGIASQDLSIPGYKESPLVPYIEGEINDLGQLSVVTLSTLDDTTITLETANGKTITLMDAWCCGELVVETEDGKYKAKFEGVDLDETTSTGI
jgi:hypothetical protein